jgi:AcrR family transcriptional regulator
MEQTRSRRAARKRSEGRRTQAERSAETCERIIAAATACVAELGFRNTTMQNIAKHAAVTWGAMQHQFGDKDAIIDAVIERSLEEFSRLMVGLREAAPDLEHRIHTFTERAWVAFKGPYYRVVLEILLHCPEKVEGVASAFTRLWEEHFGDLHLSSEQQFTARRFTFVMLSGIATESLVVPGVEPSKHHFMVLEHTLLSLLAHPEPQRERRSSAAR